MINMTQNAKEQAAALAMAAYQAAVKDGSLPEAEISAAPVEIPRDASNGDFTTTFALAASKALRQPPRAIAQALLDRETISGEDLDLLMENRELPPLEMNGKPLKSSGVGDAQEQDRGGDFVLEPDDADARGQTPPAETNAGSSRPEPPDQKDQAAQAELKAPDDHAEQDKK